MTDKNNKSEQIKNEQVENILGLGKFSARKSYYPELQQTIKKLREEKERYEKIFSQAIHGIFQAELEGKIVVANPAFIKLLNYDSSEELQSIKDISKDLFNNEKDYKGLLQFIELNKSTITFETQFKNKKGELFDVSLNGSIIKNNGNKVLECFVLDITETKRIEKQLEATQLHYREFINSSSDFVSYWKMPKGLRTDLPIKDQMKQIYESVCIDSNTTFHKAFGFAKKEDLIGKKYFDITQIDTYKQLVTKFIENNYSISNFETMFITKEGNELYLESTWYGKIENGCLTHIWADSKDITKNKIAEAKLRESERKFRELAENSATIIYRIILSPVFRFDYVSPIVTEIIGYTPEDHYTDPNIGIKIIHPEDRHLIENIGTNTSSNPVTIRWIKKNGEIIYTLHYYNIKTDENGIPLILEGSARDITDQIKRNEQLESLVKERTLELEKEIKKQKKAEKIVREALDQEKQVNELKTRFISTVSHEIRTPLTAIKSSSDLLRRYHERWDIDKKMEHLARINNSVEHLTNLLENVLTMSRTETGKIIYSPSVINIYEFICAIVNQQKLIDVNNHQINYNFVGNVDEIESDPKLLSLIINNIISNAIKYSPPKTNVSIEVEINDSLHIIVQDHGIGIPKEGIDLIFEPFYRAENAEKFKGSGLGLSIVKKTIDMLGGTVSIVSEINKGTKFNIKLPLKKK